MLSSSCGRGTVSAFEMRAFMAADDDISMQDQPGSEGGRYVLQTGGQDAAHIDYRLADGRMDFQHTVVAPQYEGQGVGSRLARFALDDARGRGLGVVPTCEFIAAFIERHPEYEDIVSA
jgi:predicted GNAT family acetyltransferase